LPEKISYKRHKDSAPKPAEETIKWRDSRNWRWKHTSIPHLWGEKTQAKETGATVLYMSTPETSDVTKREDPKKGSK